jgi:hypothetical protein
MYCPRCSHHAAPNTNVRFCPGCGLWLQGVTELIANDGFFTQGAKAEPKPRRSLVKRGALLGATLMFAGFFLTLAILPHAGKKGPVLAVFFFYWVALMAFVGMSGYLKRLITNIFSLFSEEEHSSSKKIAYTLPLAYSAPGADPYRQFVDTAKMGQPSSVAEQTTSRLNNA